MNVKAKAAAWRAAKAFIAGIMSFFLVALFANQSLLSDVIQLNFSNEVLRSLGGIFMTAFLLALAKYFNLRLPAPPTR